MCHVQGNLEMAGRLSFTIAAGMNNGTTSGGNRGAESELRGANSALAVSLLTFSLRDRFREQRGGANP